MNTGTSRRSRKHADPAMPALVLKMEHYGSLGIVRSLGRLGVPVYGIDRNESAPGFHSRYCAGRFLWDVDSAPEADTIDYLLKIGKRLGTQSVLIPTSDEMAILVADFAEVLEQSFVFPQTRFNTVARLTDKKEMYALAKRFHIPVPQTEFPRSRNDIQDYLDHIRFPILLKGINGSKLEERTGKKMVIVHDYSRLLELYDEMEDPAEPNLMLQEYIPGGDEAAWMFNGYFNRESDCLCAFTGRKIRQNPIHTGMTSLGICISNTTVSTMTQRFAKEVGYRGIIDIDYQYDPRDRQYKMLDVNPRVGATFRLFVDMNDDDVVRVMYRDMIGRTTIPTPVREGRRWLVEDKDILSTIKYFKEGTLTARRWFASLRGIEETGYFDRRDLFPFFRMLRNHVRRRIRKLLNYFRHVDRGTAATPEKITIQKWISGHVSTPTTNHQRQYGIESLADRPGRERN